MSTPATPSSPTPAGDDRNLVPVDATTALSFDEKLQLFWEKRRGLIFALCGLAILAILAKGGYEYLQRQKHADVQKAYAAATTTEQLKSFVAAQGDHPLSAVAQIRIADEAYTAGKSADAIAGYDKVLTILKDGPLAARAKLGRAIAKVQAGKASEATTELKSLADDTNQVKAVRAEAAYHLTSLAVEARNVADAQKYSDQLMQIDPTSQWTQRGLSLRASLPAPAAPASAAAGSVDAAPKKDESGPSVQVKVPGK
jgi:hypothetical protein